MLQKLNLTQSQKVKMPTWYRTIYLILLIWTAFWLYLYYTANSLTEKELLNLPIEGRQLYLDIPFLVFLAGGVGIVSSLIGLILVQKNKKIASWFFALAFTGILIRDGWFLMDGRVLELISNISLILSSSLLISYLIQFLLSLLGVKRKWLI